MAASWGQRGLKGSARFSSNARYLSCHPLDPRPGDAQQAPLAVGGPGRRAMAGEPKGSGRQASAERDAAAPET